MYIFSICFFNTSPYSNLHSKNLVLQLVASWAIFGAKLTRLLVFPRICIFLVLLCKSFIGFSNNSYLCRTYKGKTQTKWELWCSNYCYLYLFTHTGVEHDFHFMNVAWISGLSIPDRVYVTIIKELLFSTR